MSNATRDSDGMISFRYCKRFALSSTEKFVNPVALPPGRRIVSTRLAPTGSGTYMNTTGIVDVAFFR